MSLEWDARNDGEFLAELDTALAKASAVLYDVSDGQMALGDVDVYFNKEEWLSADIVMYAQTGIRPRATMGGIASELIDDENPFRPTHYQCLWSRPNTALGPNWDPFGLSLTELTQDWPTCLCP